MGKRHRVLSEKKRRSLKPMIETVDTVLSSSEHVASAECFFDRRYCFTGVIIEQSRMMSVITDWSYHWTSKPYIWTITGWSYRSTNIIFEWFHGQAIYIYILISIYLWNYWMNTIIVHCYWTQRFISGEYSISLDGDPEYNYHYIKQTMSLDTSSLELSFHISGHTIVECSLEYLDYYCFHKVYLELSFLESCDQDYHRSYLLKLLHVIGHMSHLSHWWYLDLLDIMDMELLFFTTYCIYMDYYSNIIWQHWTSLNIIPTMCSDVTDVTNTDRHKQSSSIPTSTSAATLHRSMLIVLLYGLLMCTAQCSDHIAYRFALHRGNARRLSTTLRNVSIVVLRDCVLVYLFTTT